MKEQGCTHMNRIARAAASHIERMEERIAQQAALIVQLRESGKSTLEAAKHLVLLRNTLSEMRIQLGALAPTQMTSGPARRAG